MNDLPFGIDISKHQGVNDFAKMRANTAFVFVKATESWGYTDPKFYANWQGLIGHNRGAYSYVWLSDDPLRQANHLIDIVTQAGVDWRYDRLVLDLEKSGHGLTKAEVSRRVLVMMERIKEVTGRYPILYSRKYWVQDNMLLTDPRLINADWWLAYYRTALPYPLYTPEMPPPPLMPNGVSKWLFHQTCEKGKGREVGVGSYYVDQNRYNGTREQLDAYFGRGTHNVYLPIVTVPEPEPVDKTHNGITLWNQHDPRWGSDKLGNSAYTIAEMGCLLCCYASVMKKFGYDTDPGRMNIELRRIGGFTQHRIYFLKPQELYPQVERHYWYGYLATANFERVKELVRKGLNPMIHVDREPSVYGMQEHWLVVLEGLENDLLVYDPYDGTVKLFSSEFGDHKKNIHRINCMRLKP